MNEEKLEKYGQEHLLKFWNDITVEQKNVLNEQISNVDFSVIETVECANDEKESIYEPLAALELSDILTNREKYTDIGITALKNGRIGAVLLAGGMGTRLGSDNPKGMYNIGLSRELYIFECLINNMIDVVKQTNAWIHLFVMTSEKNHDVTISFFNTHKYWGYNADYVHFFKQDMAPATDYDGKILLEEKWKLATSPNGNGGWFVSLVNNGLIDLIHSEGIEWLNIFSVDNVLQRIADPCFIGAVIDHNCSVGAKVVRKASPDEKVGVMCLENGKPSIVEYYELTDEMKNAKDEKGDPAYNYGVILNYLFRVTELERILDAKLPLHRVEKRIPFIDEYGEKINPDKPNGYKYETLVLDMINQMDSCLPFEVDRKKEFAPIKNKEGVDSVVTARELLMENGVRL